MTSPVALGQEGDDDKTQYCTVVTFALGHCYSYDYVPAEVHVINERPTVSCYKN